MNLSNLCIPLVLLLVLLSGCKTDRSPEKGSKVIPYKHAENIVYSRLAAEPDQLNPLISTKVYSRIVYEQIFSYLLSFAPETLELSPSLAKSRPEKTRITEGPFEGGVAYSFEIREEAKWDDGSPVTGKDFEFTLKTIFNPKTNSTAFRSYLEFVKAIEVDPTNNKKFTVFSNQRYILGEEVLGTLAVLPVYVYDPNRLLTNISLQELSKSNNVDSLLKVYPELQAFADTFNGVQHAREKGFVSGAGPYALEEWLAGEKIVLKKKANWWGEETSHTSSLFDAFPEQLVYKIIPDQTAALASLKNEGIDVSTQIDAKDFRDLEKNELMQDYFNLHSPNTYVYYYIGLNGQNAKLSDKKVRRALAHLMDVDQIIETLYYGLGERTASPIHPNKSYYHKGLEPIPYDVEKAIALLEQAGWTDTNGNGIRDKVVDGERVELELEYLVSAGSKFGKNLALLVQNNTRRAGVEVNVLAREFNSLFEDLKMRNFDLFGSGWSQDPSLDDPKQVWHTSSDSPGGSNRVGFGNAESDAVIDAIRVSLDKTQRDSLYRRFQEIVYDEQPVIFLFTPLERIAIHKRFEAGISLRRPGFFPNSFVQKDIALN